ncbi:hypothetical protein DVA86_18350 [Streptomyces armeniacus]|uniref:Uncharacterized protein n=1 Tax=Streptomyces armeniacus TaxID=83291 RepID=A0A345Y0M8_9ACTN|nr:hypothetical protein DVA86_18350 [Streptomyces armeniacus]
MRAAAASAASGARTASGRFGAVHAVLTGLLLLCAEFLLGQTGLAAPLALATATAATAALALTLTVCALTARTGLVRSAPPGRIRTALRDRQLRTAFMPQRDPDAAGRPRPRAPGRPIRTAA